jgi:hypothetical protein
VRQPLLLFATLTAALFLFTARPASVRAAHAADDHQPPIIVQIEGRLRTVIVHAGPDGPLYSVRTAEGAMLVPPMSIADMQARHPDLALEIRQLLTGRFSLLHAGM